MVSVSTRDPWILDVWVTVLDLWNQFPLAALGGFTLDSRSYEILMNMHFTSGAQRDWLAGLVPENDGNFMEFPHPCIPCSASFACENRVI